MSLHRTICCNVHVVGRTRLGNRYLCGGSDMHHHSNVSVRCIIMYRRCELIMEISCLFAVIRAMCIYAVSMYSRILQ